MSHIAAHTTAKEAFDAASTVAASSTVASSRVRAAGPAGDDSMAMQIAAMPDPVRMQMQVIARTSLNEDHALEQIIELLVQGGPEKRAAIVTAFRSNDALRTQWQRTFELLKV